MAFCTLLNFMLIFVIVTIMFGVGMIGGIPAWYRNIRENRSTCIDMKYASDADKWDPEKGTPRKMLDRHMWNLARTVQGDDPQFRQNLQTKTAECAQVNSGEEDPKNNSGEEDPKNNSGL
jgi:hypothetical protein